MSKKAIFYTIVALVLLVVALAFLQRKKGNGLPQVFDAPKASKDSCGFPLSYGNNKPCEHVKTLQRALNKSQDIDGFIVQPLATLTVDGLWGPKTQDALKSKGFMQKTMSQAEFETFT